ncbi:MAG: methionyl aminopeptidase, partial [Urechidicola sp.]
MIKIKTKEEIELMRESALVVSKTLGMLASEVKPGVTTLHLDTLAEEFIREQGAIPGFLGLYDFPNTLCMSPNEQVVHGFPNKTPLQEGDIISIDCGALKNGFYGDHAYTFSVGEIDPEIQKLLDVTKESLYKGIREFKAGNRVGDVGYAIQDFAETHGYGVVRELVGHGLGREMHEDPEMPNYGKRGRGKKFSEGMVVAIEPMINMGTHKIQHHSDGWTITTLDKKMSA